MSVFDIECDGFNPTKIHCISVKGENAKLKSTANYDNMRKYFSNAEVLVGHNIVRFDVPVVEKLLGIKIKARLVDTLALSWYLEPDRVRHGLEYYGEDFGIPKPVVTDWDGLTTEEYIHRCEEDVKINTTLWERQWKQLLRLYGSEEEAWRLVDYLSFKMDCALEQEQRKWKLDIPKATTTLNELTSLQEAKTEELAKVMPKVPKVSKKSRPAKPFKQDGSWSIVGTRWFELLRENNLDDDFDGVVEVVTEYKEPNPGSHVQVKDWLYSHGWVPETFEFKRNKETGDVRKIPQINIKNSGGDVCPSIHKLFEVEPTLKVLEGLSILTHRISILKGFLENVYEDGYIQAKIQGLTNTLRFKHQVVVNLPGVDKPYGPAIRGCLIAPDGYELLGSDMCSLEDRTGMHYQHQLDAAYVELKSAEGYDPHLQMAIEAGMITQDESEFYKWYQENH